MNVRADTDAIASRKTLSPGKYLPIHPPSTAEFSLGRPVPQFRCDPSLHYTTTMHQVAEETHLETHSESTPVVRDAVLAPSAVPTLPSPLPAPLSAQSPPPHATRAAPPS